MKRLLIATGGGDCPGLNAVIRAVVHRASQEKDWEVLGSIQAFNGVLWEPTEVVRLDVDKVKGIHFQGGTIIETTNKGGPFAWPVKDKDGKWSYVDRSDEMIRKLQIMQIDAVISIGGDGSQQISEQLYRKGLNIIGVPKTIDNDLSSTDSTFGFQTAVEIATEAVDKLVTTAASHNRVFVMEVMGREAGWIAMNAAVAGGADVCLIPEMPYDVELVKEALEKRFVRDRGFAVVIVAEGARPKGGQMAVQQNDEVGYANQKLGGIARKLIDQLKSAGFKHDMRETVLGHLQRGGVPIAYDRVLSAQFGVKAFEMVLDGDFGKMVAYRHPKFEAVPLIDAISKPNLVTPDNALVKTMQGLGICMGVDIPRKTAKAPKVSKAK
ncbi:MAG: ATP-dependent 6-phosphofructokinase [Bacteroidales bacterium]|nr:ATP-dependent 6-phosphofructokinase [Bacteroidales bacterium]